MKTFNIYRKSILLLVGLLLLMSFSACSSTNSQSERKEKVINETEISSEGEFISYDIEPTVDLNELAQNVVYPEDARRAGIEGKVEVNVLINKDGTIRKTKIISSSNELLNQAAIDAVNKTKFKPGIKKGKPMISWLKIPIAFRLVKDKQ